MMLYEDSDIDLLVEFDPEHIPGLIRLASMEIELTQVLGRKVDLRTPQDLSRYFRQEGINEAQVQYAEGKSVSGHECFKFPFSLKNIIWMRGIIAVTIAS